MRTAPRKLKWKIKASLYHTGLLRGVERARTAIRFARRQAHEPEFRFFKNFSECDGLFLDVGANMGQSVVSFRIFNSRMKIMSFEPNSYFSKDLALLKRLLGSQFDYRMSGLGENSGRKTLYFPVVDGVPLTQEGTFNRKCLEEDETFRARIQEATGRFGFEIHKQEFDLLQLDDLDLSPDFVKLDVQGFELDALKGMPETIKRSEPIFLIENNPDIDEIQSYLAAYHYSNAYSYLPTANRLVLAKDDVPRLNLFFISSKRKPLIERKGLVSCL